MGLRLDVGVHIYGSSDGQLATATFNEYADKIEQSVKRSFDWIEEYSDFRFNYDIKRLRTHTWVRDHDILRQDYSWNHVAFGAPFVIVFYYELQPPNGGATWPIGNVAGWNCTCLSIPYGYTNVHWTPQEGYPQYMDAILVHETLHATDSWLEFLGYPIYKIKHIFHGSEQPGEYIDCNLYPSHVECYAAVLDQYGPQEYQMLADHWGTVYKTPKLTTNSPINYGGTLSFSFEGFTPHESIHVYVQGGGGLYINADINGEGSSAFSLGESPGTYKLIAEEGPDRAESIFVVVGTSPPPNANFSFTPNNGYAPFTVFFTDTSSGDVTSREWSFGDGGYSTTKNPSHTYYNPGVYNVTLEVLGPGGIDSITKQVVVLTEPVEPPVAGFDFSPETGYPPLSVQFMDNSTGEIINHQWNFGDGYIVSAINTSHTYQNAGTYTVTKTVFGPGGYDSESKTIVVMQYPAPVADFDMTPTEGNVPLTVSFQDKSQGIIDAYIWQFSDGGQSTERHPTHTFNTSGDYRVYLTVIGPGGEDTEERLVRVTEPGVEPPPPFDTRILIGTIGGISLLLAIFASKRRMR